MGYEENNGRSLPPHKLTMEDCRELWMTGVEEVESFDEGEVAVRTARGVLYVRGESLKVDKLEKASGELHISGQVSSLDYAETGPRTGFLARLFR